MRKISDNTNRIIHGILGMVLNFFYFFVSYVYVKNEFPRHIVWDIVLGIIFAVWVLYCFTFGIKWEMKHLEEKAKKIEQQEDESSKVLSMSIEDLELSVRSFNCLKRAGINTVEQLCNKTPDDMMKVRNLGKKSLDEVLLKLKELNLQLSPNED